ncbi:MAG: hypothetical protein OXF98_14330, partial [Rhodospirillaceae bacterium]|nr:hypothetical protein [Rhodospirillaceae bacterium]
MYDGSYAERRTFGFSAAIANGCVSPVPALIQYAEDTPLEFYACGRCGHSESHAVPAIYLRDDGLLDRFFL